MLIKIKGTSFRSQNIPHFKDMGHFWSGKYYNIDSNNHLIPDKTTYSLGNTKFFFAAYLVPEPDNPHDPQAVAVYAPTKDQPIHIGYIDRTATAFRNKVLDGSITRAVACVGYYGDYLHNSDKPMSYSFDLVDSSAQ